MNQCEIYGVLFRKYGSRLGFSLSEGFIIAGERRGFDIDLIWEEEKK